MKTGELGASLLTAVGLLLMLEGLLPLASPRSWRDAVQKLAGLRDGQIRFVGLASVLAGMLIVLFA